MKSWNRTQWMAIVGLLIFTAIRYHNLLALPLFLDESISVSWSVDTLSGKALHFGSHGKYLLPWWGAIFYPLNAGPFVFRIATILLTLPGAAAIYTLGKLLHSRFVGIVSLLAISFSPMLFFFDRMALTDTVMHSMISVFVLVSFRMLKRPSVRKVDAVLAGIVFVLSFLAKSTALLLLPLPLVGVIILPDRWTVRQRIQAIGMLYITIAIIWTPLQLLMLSRKINYLGLAQQYSSGQGTISGLEKLLHNFNFMIQGPVTYFGIPFVIISIGMVIIALRYARRESLFLLAAIGGFSFGVIFFGVVGLSIRYWLGIIPISVLLVIFGATLLMDQFRRSLPRSQYIVPALLFIWIISFAFPFILTAYSSPETLPLVAKDRGEYIMSESSGTSIPELVDFFAEKREETSAPVVVVGAIVQCYSIFLYTSADMDVTIECPNVLAGGYQGKGFERYMEELIAQYPNPYIIFESPGYVSPEDIRAISLEHISNISRPGEQSLLAIYRVHQQ